LTEREKVLTEAFDAVRTGGLRVARQLAAAPAGSMPAFGYLTGGYRMSDAYDPDFWATFQWAGFLAGRLWLTAEHFDDEEIRAAALRVSTTVGEVLSQRPPKFSAAGSDLFYSVCLGARLTGDQSLVDLGVASAWQYTKNFVPHLDAFLQVPGVNRAVIDTGLNLLPFYWGTEHDPGLLSYAVRHNTTLLRKGIIREDGSAFQAIEFHEGTADVRRRYNMQGYADDTTWARGQSWAMHNYTNAYEATGNPEFLEVARAASRWYVDHLPGDHIPFYDFADPAIPAVPRDSCSAAISANALLKLAHLDQESRSWALPAGESIVDELVANYLSPGGVLLRGSWGRLPPEKAGAGISRFPLEDVMPYGNYWIVEALYRSLHDNWAPLSLATTERIPS
jgi:unsaturated chondroitin disaccharide hydrolase